MHWLLQWCLNVKQLLFWTVLHKNVESNKRCFMAHHIAAVVVWQTDFLVCVQNITNFLLLEGPKKECRQVALQPEHMAEHLFSRTYGAVIHTSSYKNWGVFELILRWILVRFSDIKVVSAHCSMHVPFNELCKSEYILSNTRDEVLLL